MSRCRPRWTARPIPRPRPAGPGDPPLYAAYAALDRARAARQPLDLDLPERRIELSEEGKVLSVAFKERLDAHKLIEEFMVLANVAAAEELIACAARCCSACTRNPAPTSWMRCARWPRPRALRWPRGRCCKTAHLNRLLAQAEGTDFDELLNITTLRSMTQAYYHPQNFGHFGLALRNYAHFTSPIRRYSDLIVHRALIAGHGWGDDGLSAQDIESSRKPPSRFRTPSGGPWPPNATRPTAIWRPGCPTGWARPSPAGSRGAALRPVRAAGRDGRRRADPDPRGGARVLSLRPRQPDPDGRRYRHPRKPGAAQARDAKLRKVTRRRR
jgi:hypothetical protein